MLNVNWLVKISLLIMVCLSGILLGASQGNPQLSMVAIIGACLGFFVADVWGVFKLKGWMANVASIGILIFAMQDFFAGNGATKLIAVSNLLIYLQTVLMFQEKTPRLNWQVMVLSLLQAVVAAIFNLNFEGGLVFVLYFVFAALTMLLQSTFSDNIVIRRANSRNAKRLKKHLFGRTTLLGNFTEDGLIDQSRPVAIFDASPSPRRSLSRMTRHLALWLVASLTFTTILFYSIPRGSSAWFGPKFRQMQPTGISKAVDLDEDGKIEQTGKMFLRTWFEPRRQTGEKIPISGSVYVRGMALGQLKIVDDKTTWTAPYDRLNTSSYVKLSGQLGPGRTVRQFFTLEPTDDPLVYMSMPVLMGTRSPYEIEFCHEISAFTRRRSSEQIELSPYSYEVFTKVDDQNQMLESWPYFTDMIDRPFLPLTESEAKFSWLTEIDKARYPEVVRVAEELSANYRQMRRDSLVQFLKLLEAYFLDPQIFSYTMDFTDVPKDRSIDPVEDFFANHRTGHCELYASALTLMLRSLNIPARLVVGFHTTESSTLTDTYVVRGNNAHAWVEAYIPPEHCTDRMKQLGGASPGGAWLRLDPTPPSSMNSSESSIELARTFWQDYVLGLDNENQNPDIVFQTPTSLLGLFDLSNWNEALQTGTGRFIGRPIWQIALLAGLLVAILFGLYQAVLGTRTRSKKKKKRRATQQHGVLRRMFGGALSLISPNLGKWVLGESPGEITAAFYRHLTRILASQQLRRLPNQTQREFASTVSRHYREHPHADQIDSVVSDVTEAYYGVRFGGNRLDKQRVDELERKLSELEINLKLT